METRQAGREDVVDDHMYLEDKWLRRCSSQVPPNHLQRSWPLTHSSREERNPG
jgi:hypothetical protein